MRRRKRRLQGEVELNLASMLDMAFQLLAFFILTFRPAPAEGQLLLHLPPPEPIAKPLSGLPDGTAPSEEAVASEKTLEIRLACDAAGKLASIGVGFGTAFAAGDDKSLAVLDQQLQQVLETAGHFGIRLGLELVCVTMIAVGHNESPWGLKIPKKTAYGPPFPRSLFALSRQQ